MISLHEPQFDSDDEKLLLEALRSSWVSTGGPFVDKFEKEFAEFVGAKYAISVCNGTIGLQLAIEGLKRKLGILQEFEIILPSLTFIATANAISHAGGTPIFIDVNENSLQASPEKYKEILLNNYEYKSKEKCWINKNTYKRLLALIPVHIMGWAVFDGSHLLELSNNFNIPILEDAAEALGTYYLDGTHIGNNSLATVYSFNGNKVLTTGGGGMITTNNDAFASHLKHLSTTSKIDNLRFVHDEIGYNYRLVNVLAALGCSQLSKLKNRLVRKKEIFDLYTKYIDSSLLNVYKQKNCYSNYWLNCIVFPNFTLREKALSMLIENSIQARPLWTPCHLQPAYKNNQKMFLKFTEEVWEKTLSLPSSPQITNTEIKNISNIILSSINGSV